MKKSILSELNLLAALISVCIVLPYSISLILLFIGNHVDIASSLESAAKAFYIIAIATVLLMVCLSLLAIAQYFACYHHVRQTKFFASKACLLDLIDYIISIIVVFGLVEILGRQPVNYYHALSDGYIVITFTSDVFLPIFFGIITIIRQILFICTKSRTYKVNSADTTTEP